MKSVDGIPVHTVIGKSEQSVGLRTTTSLQRMCNFTKIDMLISALICRMVQLTVDLLYLRSNGASVHAFIIHITIITTSSANIFLIFYACKFTIGALRKIEIVAFARGVSLPKLYLTLQIYGSLQTYRYLALS